MATTTTSTGLFLQQYVEPQLLVDFKNDKDDFIGKLRGVNSSAVDKDGIRFNKLINTVGFHINKNTGFVPKAMGGEKTLVEWDKLDTDPTEITDAELRALAFDKKAEVRVKHTEAFKLGVRDYAVHALAPTANVDGKTPVIRTTGTNDGNGRKRLTYKDLIDFLILLETLNLPDIKAWHMILSSEHRGDLLIDRSSTNDYRDIELDKSTGGLKRLHKLNFFENNQSATYDASGTLKSAGAVNIATDKQASIFFYSPNTVYHIEKVKILYKPMAQDTRNSDPKEEIRLHSYGLCAKRQNYGFGAIISDKV